MRRLVILRCGDRSLHRNWTRNDRKWKLAISSFASSDRTQFPESDYFHFFKGGKWDGIHAFFEANPAVLSQFDTFWLPDDDINATPETIEKMFLLFNDYDLELAQPSLTRDSYFSHPITVNNRLAKLRYTNFVEIMVPVMKRSVLAKILPLFKHSKSGFGIDYFWARLTSNPSRKCAIIDEISVHHTRPIGSALAKEMKIQGTSPKDEMQQLSELMNYDLEGACPPVIHALISRSANLIETRLKCGLLQIASQLAWPPKQRRFVVTVEMSIRALHEQIARTPDITVLNCEWIPSDTIQIHNR